LAGETILIIDDNADVRTLLGERVLPSYGYRTLTAPDGQEGLWQIRTHKPDLILLDLRLPDMTGLDLLHILSSEGYDTPVILITAYGSELIAAQSLRLGVHDYIIKPFTLDEIVESVERALTEQRLRSERNALSARLQYCTTALRGLADAGAEVTRAEDPYLQLCRLLETIITTTHARSGRIWVAELPESDLYLRVAQDQTDQRAYLLHRREQLVPQVEQVLASGVSQQWERTGPEVSESGLAVPIPLAGRPAGVLEIYVAAEVAPHGDPCLLILQTFAELIGMVLDWSHLHSHATVLERQVDVLGQLSQDMLLVLNESDVITDVNPAITTLLGQSPDVAIGQKLSNWIQGVESPPGEFMEWYSQQSGEARTTGRYAFFFQGPRGESRQAEIQVMFQKEEDGQPWRYLLFHDVTAYNRLEQQVRSLRRDLGEFMRGSHVGLFLTDLKGTVLAVNGGLTDLLQLAPEALLGQPLWEAFAGAEGGHLLAEEIARTHREGSGYAEVRWSEQVGPLGITALLLLGPQATPHAIAVLVGPAQTSSAGLASGRPGNEGNLLGSPGLDPGARS
jgi:PAS domain S-box-containing protein